MIVPDWPGLDAADRGLGRGRLATDLGIALSKPRGFAAVLLVVLLKLCGENEQLVDVLGRGSNASAATA
jgi:hypothetical protein